MSKKSRHSNRRHRDRDRRFDRFRQRDTDDITKHRGKLLSDVDFKSVFESKRARRFDVRKRLEPMPDDRRRWKPSKYDAYVTIHYGPLHKTFSTNPRTEFDRNMPTREDTVSPLRRKLVCMKRKARRVAMFAKGHIGSGAGVKIKIKRRYNDDSKIKC